MKTKHTPGPWRATDEGYVSSKGRGYVPIVSPFIYEANRDKLTGGANQEALANARLIAAAPELLEALKACEYLLAELESDGAGVAGGEEKPELERARAAIAKAEGEIA